MQEKPLVKVRLKTAENPIKTQKNGAFYSTVYIFHLDQITAIAPVSTARNPKFIAENISMYLTV